MIYHLTEAFEKCVLVIRYSICLPDNASTTIHTKNTYQMAIKFAMTLYFIYSPKEVTQIETD